jgi:putative ABC transport system permease protein
MLKNYVLIAWRNLKKNKIFSLINIFGLTIGITVCMMIYLFIIKQYSYDSFHSKGDSIYRVMRDFSGNEPLVPYVSGPYATALLNDYPGQVVKAVRVMRSNGLITHGEHSFNEKNLILADPGFFEMFDFPLKKGTASSVLKDPSGVVLTEESARRYFGEQDPIGQILTLDNEHQFKVTGITSIPDN